MNQCTDVVSTVQDLTPSYEDNEELKWDLKLIQRLNMQPLEAQKIFKCLTNDLNVNLMQLKKHYSINDMSTYIYYDEKNGTLKYNENKLQLFKEDKSDKKTLYSFGFKTLSKPRLCYMWDQAHVKLCKGAFGDFHIVTMTNGTSLINVMEQLMGWYMMKMQRQSDPVPLTMEDGSLIAVPKDLANKDKFMSKFFVLDTSENMKNIQDNNIQEPIMLTRMSLDMYNKLFHISEDKKVSELQNFIVCSTFNGVEEKTKILQPSKESQFTFYLWLTPIIFIYIKDN